MEKEKIFKKKIVIKLLKTLSEKKKLIFDEFVEIYTDDCFKPRRLDCFIDILLNNEENHFEKYDIYQKSPSAIYSKELRYGKKRAEQYRQNLLNRPKIDRSKQNNYDAEYIANVHNVSIEEAEKIIEERKKKISVKNAEMHKRLKDNGYSYRENNPMCLEYWIKRKVDNPEEKHNEYIAYTRTNREGFALRHGKEKGDELFDKWVCVRRETWLKKYGTTMPTSGRTSRESLKFFVPLYKELRKNGIDKEDVYWEISGSKEFAHRSEKLGNFFFDFTIKSLKYIIEYHGSLWHPHPDKEFKGFINGDEALERDFLKKKHMERKGYKVIYVWDFEDKEQRLKEIVDDINKMLKSV